MNLDAVKLRELWEAFEAAKTASDEIAAIDEVRSYIRANTPEPKPRIEPCPVCNSECTKEVRLVRYVSYFFAVCAECGYTVPYDAHNHNSREHQVVAELRKLIKQNNWDSGLAPVFELLRKNDLLDK